MLVCRKYIEKTCKNGYNIPVQTTIEYGNFRNHSILKEYFPNLLVITLCHQIFVFWVRYLIFCLLCFFLILLSCAKFEQDWTTLILDILKSVWKRMSLYKWPLYDHFWLFFHQMYVHLSQNWGSDGHFEVLNRSKSWLVQKLWPQM